MSRDELVLLQCDWWWDYVSTDIHLSADYTLNEISNNQQGRQAPCNGGVGVGIQQFGGGSNYMNNTTTFQN